MTERFTLLTELGRGGMGVVWKARDDGTGKVVALKILREAYADDPDYVGRFERELELARRIHSRHVVQVLGYGMRDGAPYLALEYVDGQSLRELLVSHGPYPWPETEPLLAQMAQGLADAHAAGVIHRDLKPSNILIDAGGTAKIADFGIAKGLDLTRLTGTSTLLGTPAYLPPEGPVDERSDLYSLGIIAFEMLAGAPPFEGHTYQEVILRHVREAPNLDRLPQEARKLVGWLLAKDPSQRPGSAGELLPVLWGAPVPAGTSPTPATTTTATGRPTVVARADRNSLDGSYTREASSDAPQLVIYVVDVSDSMALPLGASRRIDVVTNTLVAAIRQMVSRSLKGSTIAPRYRVALIAYNDRPHDVFSGVVTIGQVAEKGIPTFKPTGPTATAAAFGLAENILRAELQTLSPDAPAPLVCHVTDSKYSGKDPADAAARIKAIRVPDGNVLLENVFISDHVLGTRVANPRTWPGVNRSTAMVDTYAQTLRDMSSPLPESYRRGLTQAGYQLSIDALMMLPGETPELVGLALQMSAASVGVI
jgi:serine/threonine protein kinase